MKKAELYAELRELTAKLSEVEAVIVEGARDAKALRELGFAGDILLCSARLSRGALIDSVASCYQRVAILTDFDQKGRKLCRELMAGLERRGVKIEKRYRRLFRKVLVKRGMRAVEAISSLGRLID